MARRFSDADFVRLGRQIYGERIATHDQLSYFEILTLPFSLLGRSCVVSGSSKWGLAGLDTHQCLEWQKLPRNFSGLDHQGDVGADHYSDCGAEGWHFKNGCSAIIAPCRRRPVRSVSSGQQKLNWICMNTDGDFRFLMALLRIKIFFYRRSVTWDCRRVLPRRKCSAGFQAFLLLWSKWAGKLTFLCSLLCRRPIGRGG